MSQRPSILNLDLRLRAAFPHLDTKIYELGPYNHIIVAPREQLDADGFSDEFDREWRMIGDRVEFRNNVPSNGKLIESLADHDIGSNLPGIFLNRDGIMTVLEGKYPSLPKINSIRDGRDNKVYIGLERLPKGEFLDDLDNFLSAALHGRPFEFEIVDKPNPKPEINDPKVQAVLTGINGLSVKPIQSRSNVPEFIKDEEYWWFDKLPQIFAGQIPPSSIKPNCRRDTESACYLHSASGPQLDIRQLLLAYDVVYMEPPFTDGKNDHLSFWSNQAITSDELLTLIEADRVRFVHSQSEERGDLGLLREAKEVNPDGVLGRRKTAALMIADIVETADEYILGDHGLRKEMDEVIRRLADEHNAPHQEISRALLFPEYMRRACFEPFNDRGLVGLWNIGQGKLFGDMFRRVHGKKIDLEASSFGQSVHIAHMLDATFIPMVDDSGYVDSWLPPSTAMGGKLNFYRSFNSRIAAAWVDNEARKVERKQIVPGIPLFDFRDGVTVHDILQITQQFAVRIGGNSLISRLSELPVEQRKEEISRLSLELEELIGKQASRKKKLVLADAAINLGAYALGKTLFPFSPALLLLKEVLKVARQAPSLDQIISKIERAFEEQTGKNADLTFLSKVSRVAQIKQE